MSGTGRNRPEPASGAGPVRTAWLAFSESRGLAPFPQPPLLRIRGFPGRTPAGCPGQYREWAHSKGEPLESAGPGLVAVASALRACATPGKRPQAEPRP